MQSLIDLTSEDLKKGFNFISKVCAAELGEINILPTDRIITSAYNEDTEYSWNRARIVEMDKHALEILNAGYIRKYRTHFGGNVNYDDIDFRIYVSALKNSTTISYLRETKFTKDQTASINLIIPDLYKVCGDENVSKDMKIFKIIYNAFNYFLRANHEPALFGLGTIVTYDISVMAKSAASYIRNLSAVFTLLTGLFPEGFTPEKINPDLINLADEMFKDQSFTSRAREGSVTIISTDYKLFDYMYKVALVTDKMD